MKKRNSLLIGLAVISAILLYSCSATNLLTMSVQEPAPVYVPSSVKTVGIVNRSLPEEKNKILDDVEKILSAEGKNLDKEGAQECISGLYNELSKNERFTEVKLLDKVDIKSPGAGVFPASLSWDVVSKICKENSVDAIFVLSFYDTDATVAYSTKNVEIDGPLGVKVPAIETHASITTRIKAGWRIYDPEKKLIYDEFIVNETAVSSGSGLNPMKAVSAIMGRKEAVKQLSLAMGQNYAWRILPYWIRVSRDYFVRGTDNFITAKRRAQTGNWDGAAELWLKETSSPERKVAGRACYNMAIINEINGDLDEAIKWASQSWADYGIKLALRYIDVLKYRKERARQLEMQQQ
ncbi:MAG: DUF6340 family protein [Bacteroidota bacterium]